jgi:hypothetical protein
MSTLPQNASENPFFLCTKKQLPADHMVTANDYPTACCLTAASTSILSATPGHGCGLQKYLPVTSKHATHCKATTVREVPLFDPRLRVHVLPVSRNSADQPARLCRRWHERRQLRKAGANYTETAAHRRGASLSRAPGLAPHSSVNRFGRFFARRPAADTLHACRNAQFCRKPAVSA